jgi:hypothetical protein
VLALALAMLPATRPEVPASSQRSQISPLRVADQHDVAAAAAITAVGPSPGDMGLAPEADHAVAAAASLHVDLRPVEKHPATLDAVSHRT